MTPLERAFYRRSRAAHLIAISRSLGGQIEREYGWDRATHVIYHGTDAARFRPANDPAEREMLRRNKFGLPDRRWIWLFMGEAPKGLSAAIAQLASFPHAHLLVVSRSDMTDFRAQARSSGVEAQITFHGFDSKAEDAFRAADVFVYPSGYDSFGLVVTEAMASGLPVIVGDSIGAAELVVNRQNGLHCLATDPDSVKACLKFLDTLSDRGAAIGVEARKTAMIYSWDRCAHDTMLVYEQALREKALER